MYCNTVACRSSGIVNFRRRNGNLRTAESAAAFTAGMALSYCMDDSLYADGNILVSGAYIGRHGEGDSKGSYSICLPIGGKFSLAHLFLQFWLVFVCFCLVGTFVGINTDHDHSVLPAVQTGCIFNDTLSSVGNLCRIFESGYLVAELGND